MDTITLSVLAVTMTIVGYAAYNASISILACIGDHAVLKQAQAGRLKLEAIKAQRATQCQRYTDWDSKQYHRGNNKQLGE